MKCNMEMIELLPLEKDDDCRFVKDLLRDFVAETGSEVAKQILADWDDAKKSFKKVFPYEYQRALKELEEEKMEVVQEEAEQTEAAQEESNGGDQMDVQDIESVVKDGEMAKRKEEQLDKKKGFVK